MAMTPLHAKAYDLLGKVFGLYGGDRPIQELWSRADLHELKRLSDSAGGETLKLGRAAVDQLDVVAAEVKRGRVDRSSIAAVASILDQLATHAEIGGL